MYEQGWGVVVMKRILLIDGDVLVYQTAFKSEEAIDWGDDLWTLHSDLDNAIEHIEHRLKWIKDTLQSDSIVVALTDHEANFRKEIFAPYKSNRQGNRKPLTWKPLRDYLVKRHKAKIKPSLEGDDVLGILATLPDVRKDVEKIIVSIDKDFKSVPGFYYNLDHPENGILESNIMDADYNHMLQTLIGDSTDGYPGCQGIGKKKAVDVLNGEFTYQEMWPKVVAAFAKAGFGEEFALTQARCARILRASDYDFENKKPILWRPT